MECFSVICGCVSVFWLFGGGVTTSTFYLKLSSVTQPLCYSSSALHPSSKHTHANTLHTPTFLQAHSITSLAAPRWKVNKSCVCSGTLSALICLWSCSTWKRPCVHFFKGLHSVTLGPCCSVEHLDKESAVKLPYRHMNKTILLLVLCYDFRM